MSKRNKKSQQKKGSHSKKSSYGPKATQKNRGIRNHNSHPVIGRVQKNIRGFAFLIPQDKTKKDAFLPHKEAKALMTGDLVEYYTTREGHRTTAHIKQIVKRHHKEVVGRTLWLGHEPLLETPEKDLFHIKNLQHQSKDIIEDNWVTAEILTYPSSESSGVVQIIEYLGSKLKPEFDLKVAAAKFGFPILFSHKTMIEAKSASLLCNSEMSQPKASRKDLRSLPFITIDGKDAKDFDDAILVKHGESEIAFILYVSIADVSFFVRPNSALDQDARKRGTSIYFPGIAVPMLPEELSNNLCSLMPQQDKLCLTAEIHFDRNGNVLNATFYESIIKTVKRLTYHQVHEFFGGSSQELNPLKEQLNAALSLYKKLKLRREERGALDFELPESHIEVDNHGNPTGMWPSERFESHKLIEEFMIAANSEVARHLRLSKHSALYRVHEACDPSSKDEINSLMKNLGISKTLKNITPRELSALLKSTAHMKSVRTLHQAILRMQKQAHYEPEPKGHFGLALRDYTHFTSPIRRYPDLMVHRALKAVISKNKHTDKNFEGIEYFIQIGVETSLLERKAMEAERFVRRRKQCWYMKQHEGEEFYGTISGVVESGLFVEIQTLAVEGFVPLKLLDGYHVYDERKMCLRRRPGHTTLSIGDGLKVWVREVDIEQGFITLSNISE